MKIWINAGEISGDLQSAELLKALKRRRPDVDALGMGGPALQAAGMRCLLRSESLSVMGLVEVLSLLPRAFSMLAAIRRHLREERPDCVIVTDAPDFNFFVVRIARSLGIPCYYFIPPKIWAHRTGRVEFLKKNIRRVFAILPFETDFYKEHDTPVEYFGNPLVDAVDPDSLAGIAPVPGRIGLMPGSRRKEVESLLPAFSAAADLIFAKHPETEFRLFRAPNFSEGYLRGFWSSKAPLVLEEPKDRYKAMAACSCMMAASGTATLETALAGVPTLVAYKLSPITYRIARRVVKVKWISLTNLILGREAFPEHIQEDADPQPMARRILSWLDDPSILKFMRADCDECRRLCGEKGSADRVAVSLLKDLAQ